MVRSLLASLGLLLCAGLGVQAHFVFVVPAKDGANAVVVFSDDLEADEAVGIEKINPIKLQVRDASGKDHALTHKADKHSLTATLPGNGARVVYGSVNYGVMQKGDAKPFLLAYHPKAVIGAIEKSTIGEKLPAELIPEVAGSKVRFKLVAGGKPVAGAEVTVIKPGGDKAKLKTGTDGLTNAVEGSGRFGAWTRHTEVKSGEVEGKKYDEIRHYPTLVFDAGK